MTPTPEEPVTGLPPEITDDLDAHRTALALIHAILAGETDQVWDLWFTRLEDERDDIARALATQAGAYLTARYGGDEHGKQAAIRFAESTLLDMAREDGR